MTAQAGPADVVRRSPVAAVVAVVGVAVALVVSVARDLVWASYQDGRIRTKGLPSGVRVAVLGALALAVAMFASIASSASWRRFDPHVMTGGQPLRGTLVPELLVPVTFAVIAVAAALCVSGALRSGPWVGVGVGATYGVVATFVNGYTVGDDALHRVAGWAIIALLVLIAVVRFLPPHPVIELLACISLIGLTFADAHRLLVASDRASGADFLASQTEVLLSDVLFLSAPLLVVAALGVVDFGVTSARWGVGFAEVHLSRRVTIVLAVALGLWRLRDLGRVISDRVADGGVGAQLRALVGSAVVIGMLAGIAWLVRRASGKALADEDPRTATDASTRIALPLALGLTGVTVVIAVAYLFVQGVTSVLPFHTGQKASGWVIDAIPVAGRFGASGTWIMARAVGLLALSWFLARRGRPATAVFVGAIGAILVDQWATAPSRLGDSWAWSSTGIGVIAIISILCSLAVWWRRGELSERRAAWALYLLLLTGLLDRGSALSDPLAPFLAFSGVAFVLFGLIWNLATGLSWANESTPSLPRVSRSQLMVGYQVLSVAILHWYVISHDLSPLENLTQLQPDTGTALLGQPLILVLILVALAAAFADASLRIGEDAPEEGVAEPIGPIEPEPEGELDGGAPEVHGAGRAHPNRAAELVPVVDGSAGSG